MKLYDFVVRDLDFIEIRTGCQAGRKFSKLITIEHEFFEGREIGRQS